MKKEQKQLDRLYDAFTLIKSREEAAAFLEDLCTIKEIQDMSQRLDAAKMLKNGESYLAIAGEIGISTATIGRVSRALNYGSSGGYELILERMNEEAEEKND